MHQVTERGIDRALAGDAVEADEGGRFDDQREMAFASAVVAGVADVAIALVVEFEPGRGEGCDEATPDLGGDRSGGGGDVGHGSYI